ncbi:MAG: alanyl-tRNA editing protein [Oscillospiraceae bacterium]|nr:alanyl-tRNA editing protein [Oscillospiraceae bacterium]
MATQRLYDQDSHCAEFSAEVVSCQQVKNGYAVILSRTAFYPEGGGQPGDTGMLADVRVLDTYERDGEVVHLCEKPMEAGAAVDGKIDWDRRLELMQQHSGEHIVSGIINRRFGYDNVGFHMGAEFVTIDFNGMLDMAQLQDIEREANEIIWSNIAVQTLLPSAEELPKIDYRSKKELTGTVRIVRIAGADVCACCGTHVKMTGEIGFVKLLSCQKFHDGVRIEMLCGRKALAYLSATYEQNRQISGLLSAPPVQTAQAAERLLAEQAQMKLRVTALERRLTAARIDEVRRCGDVLLFESDLSAEALRELADGCAQVCLGRAAVFCGSDADGYKYILAQKGGDLRETAKMLNAELNGRGGGKPEFVQGSVQASRAAIEAFFKAGDV